MSQSNPSDTSAVPSAPGAAPAGPPPQAGAEVESLLRSLEAHAAALEGQPEALLQLLRRLEQLHRAIQDGPFRASLPSDRNALFQLLSEMERSGGWPYIPRLQLRTFLDLLGARAPVGVAEPLASGCPELGVPDPNGLDLAGAERGGLAQRPPEGGTPRLAA